MAPLKLAIVGGGPSAFYVASRSLSLLPESSSRASQLKIHMYDRLWAPYGLVRYGVAPDHPEVKVRLSTFGTALVLTLGLDRTARTSLQKPPQTHGSASSATSMSASPRRSHTRCHSRSRRSSPTTPMCSSLPAALCPFSTPPSPHRSSVSLRCHSCTGIHSTRPGRHLLRLSGSRTSRSLARAMFHLTSRACF